MSAAEDGSLHISIPDWFPQPLEDAVRDMHAMAVRSRSPGEIAAVQRLVRDPRMKAVWAEFQKRRRADRVFIHEAEAAIRTIRAAHGVSMRSYLNDPQEKALFHYHFREMHRLERAKRQALTEVKKIQHSSERPGMQTRTSRQLVAFRISTR
jgi:hypothetical protein